MMGRFINLLPIALVGLFLFIYFCNVMFINSAKNTNNTSVKTLFVNVKYTLCRIKSNVSNLKFFIKNIMSKWFSNFHCA